MLSSIISNLINERKTAYLNHRAKIEKRAEELNKGSVISGFNRGAVITTEPTWGKDNRPHSPFDGYLWEHPRTGSIDAYGAGQYLPFTDEFTDIFNPEYSGEHGFYYIRLTPEMIDAINDNSMYFHCIPGKSWEVANVMIVSTKVYAAPYLLDALKAYSEEKIKELQDTEKLSKGEAPEGKQTVNGKIINVKEIDGYYGFTLKCLIVLENKSTIWGTLPKSLDKDFRGEVTLSATFERSKDDNTHSFFKRPKLLNHN